MGWMVLLRNVVLGGKIIFGNNLRVLLAPIVAELDPLGAIQLT